MIPGTNACRSIANTPAASGRCRRWRAGLTIALVLALAQVPGTQAREQPVDPSPRAAGVEPPPLAESLARRLAAPYLRDHERRTLRVFHGVWEENDLAGVRERAQAALIRGAYDDDALADPAVDPEDRAEALVIRGHGAEALTLLRDRATLRAARLRAEALESLGQVEEARAALEPLLRLTADPPLNASPAELVELAKALHLHVRLPALGGVQPHHPPAQRYQQAMALLAAARERGAETYWPAVLEEARLLLDKHNAPQAADAAMQCLALNPRCAEAWYVLGRLHVQGFNLDAAELVAQRLDDLAAGPSPLAAMVRARARLRQGDGEGALEALAPALARHTQMRGLLALQAAAVALMHDPKEVETLLARYDALSPGSPDALLAVGAALAEARQYDQATACLRAAHLRAPHRPEPVAELGLLGLQSGDDMAALDALRLAADLDPFNVRVSNSLHLLEELVRYERVESEHFIVRYRPGPDAILAREMLPALERMYADITRWPTTSTGAGPPAHTHVLGEPDRRTTIDLMPDHRWFAVRIAGMPRIHTMAASTGPVIAMESPREGAGHSVGPYDWLRVLRHEFTHTVTLVRTRYRIPHWFTEAAAVFMEHAPRDERTCRLLRDALDNDALFDLSAINLAFVRPRRPMDRALAYAQAHWMYEFIVAAWGPEAPLRMMDSFAEGRNIESTIASVLGVSADVFLLRFRDWARTQVEQWGLRAPEGVPTLRELVASLDAPDDGLHPDASPSPSDAALARWLEQYPRHPELLELAVQRALDTAGNEPKPEMVPLLERYAAACPVAELPHRLLARWYLSQIGTDPAAAERAIAHLEFLDAREQHSATYAVELARQYAALGRLDQAADKARRACLIAPFDPPCRELAATIALLRNDHADALHHLEALVIIEPDREIHRRRLDALRQRMDPRP